MAHQHAKSPKPDLDSTNAVIKVKTRDPITRQMVEEDAPVPETHPGGLYLDAQGNWVNAHGVLLEENEETGEKVLTEANVLAKAGHNSELLRELEAKKAREDRKKKKAEAAAAKAPPQG
jgi:hypothetical protein